MDLGTEKNKNLACLYIHNGSKYNPTIIESENSNINYVYSLFSYTIFSWSKKCESHFIQKDTNKIVKSHKYSMKTDENDQVCQQFYLAAVSSSEESCLWSKAF